MTWRACALTLLVLLVGVGDAGARSRRARGSGDLAITSTTKGARVSVDGVEVGTIPLPEPLRLSVGKHTLKMALEGYTEYLDVFTIQRERTTTLEIDLLPYAGVLHIEANAPEARVFIDGKFEGTTPCEKEVLLGKHSLSVRKAGYYDYIGQVQSIAGKRQELSIKLQLMPVGSTPYRPPPPPPPKWYEKWYVWAGGAAAVAAVTAAIVVPTVLVTRDPVAELRDRADHTYKAP